ncbi:hypothetical protein SAMN04488127_0837 [Bhargavaea ginsengi]|uniref:Uncharacterized protein n=1 Tax=Bhargavaea ginsengi TaxID=426757 RepID=A0A1H6UZI9_9BACL|nr:hypothetical protein [Bhargavaea ginsengi]SEI93810.1 hypothetical protein SAMN04488127_0837 [Bhargavaea ginsengi]
MDIYVLLKKMRLSISSIRLWSSIQSLAEGIELQVKSNLSVGAAFCIVIILNIDKIISSSFIANVIKVLAITAFIAYAIVVIRKRGKNREDEKSDRVE